MATRTATLYQGEDLAPTLDYTDLVIWEESEFGTRAWQGEGNASSILIRDPLGEQGEALSLPAGLTSRSLAAKNLFIVKVGSDFLFRGRVGIKNYSRDGQHVERYRQVDCQLHDTNWDLDHIFVHNYVRPAETDRARVQGLIASYLSASPRPTTALNGSNYISSSNTVYLPEQTYVRTSPLQILREIAETANKQFFITGDTLTGGSLFYDGNDSTAYACTLSISDRATEVNYTSVFPPIWNVGPASTEDGSEMVDEVVMFYGTGEDQYVTSHSTTVHTQYGHASQTFTDDTANAALATLRAESILAHRRYEDKIYNVTIGPLTDAQVVLVEHGQTISIKARAIPDADDAPKTMRIVQCRYTTPVVGTWFAHLQLGRPWKMQPYGAGPILTPTVCHDDGKCGGGDIDDVAGKNWQFSSNGQHSATNVASTVIDGSATEAACNWLPLDEWDGTPLDFTVKISVTSTSGGQSITIAESMGTVNPAGPDHEPLGYSKWGVVRDGAGDVYCTVDVYSGLYSDTSAVVINVAAGEPFWMRCHLTSTTGSVKIWRTDQAEPSAWQAETAGPGDDLLSFMAAADLFMQVTQYETQSTFKLYFVEIGSGYNCPSCITGGPAATSGTSNDAAAADHDHGYVALGGTTGQHLAKASAADWDTEWVDESAGGGVVVQDEGTPLATNGTTLNFVGSGVAATGAGAVKTVTIPGGGGGPFEELSPDAAWQLSGNIYSLSSSDDSVYMWWGATGTPVNTGVFQLFAAADITLSPNDGTDGGANTDKVYIIGGQGLVLNVFAADPASAASQDGQIYYNSTSDTIRLRANGAWVSLASSVAPSVTSTFGKWGTD